MNKKQLQGVVVSTKMAKTVVVDVGFMKQHPKYKKRFQVNTRYQAHYEGDGVTEGDRVVIEETRPQSKNKRWRVVEIVKSSSGHTATDSAGESDASPEEEGGA